MRDTHIEKSIEMVLKMKCFLQPNIFAIAQVNLHLVFWKNMLSQTKRFGYIIQLHPNSVQWCRILFGEMYMTCIACVARNHQKHVKLIDSKLTNVAYYYIHILVSTLPLPNWFIVMSVKNRYMYVYYQKDSWFDCPDLIINGYGRSV